LECEAQDHEVAGKLNLRELILRFCLSFRMEQSGLRIVRLGEVNIVWCK